MALYKIKDTINCIERDYQLYWKRYYWSSDFSSLQVKQNAVLNFSSANGSSFITVLQFPKFFSKPCLLGILDARLGPMFVKYLLTFSVTSLFLCNCSIIYNCFFWETLRFIFCVANDFIHNFPNIFYVVFIFSK